MKYFLFIFYLFVSCSKVVDIDFPSHKTNPVINSLFKEGETIEIHLSKSVNIIDEASDNIDNADIYLYRDNILIDTFFFNGNEFESHEITSFNTRYSFKAIIPEFEEITSFDIVPFPIFIDNLEISDVSISDSEGFQLNQKFSFTVNDISEQNNYYEIVLLKRYYEEYYDDFVDDNVEYYYTQNPIIESENILQFYPKSLVFSDDLFNGNTANIDVYYNRPEVDTGTGISNTDYTLIVLFRSVSEDYYRYKKTLYQHLNNQDSDIWDGTGEPMQIYSNISGGYGIFAAYSEVRRELNN